MKLARGFTLIELLVVISIIGILATLLIVNVNAARSRARDAQRKSDLRNIATAIKLYGGDNNGDAPATGGIPFGATWTGTSGDVYMNKVPQDPLPGQTYFYKRDSGYTDKYTLSACLENKSDTSGITGTIANSSCAGGWVFVVQQ